MTARRSRTALLALLGATTLAACGTTVPLQSQAVLGQGTGLGGAAQQQPGSSSAPGSVVGVPGGTSATAGAAGARGAAAAGGPVAGAVSTPTQGVASVRLGPGVTATTVAVGIMYSASGSENSVGSSLGAKNLTYGNLLDEQKAVVDYLNAHGGAGGRKIVLVPYNTDGGGSAQAVCAAWNDDHKVFAGIYPGGQVPLDTLASCMAQHHAVFVTAPFDPGDSAFMSRFGPYYWAPRSLESVTMGRDYVQGLASQGFFQGQHKLGLLYYDVPSLRSALQQGVVPALKAQGTSLTDAYAVAYPPGPQDYASSISAVQSAVLKFQTEGIDRVMFLDAGAGLCFFFLTNAGTQHYHPGIGLESGSNPSYIEQNFSASTLKGIVGVGWIPDGDVAPAQVPDNPARTLCRQIMAAAGQRPQSQTDQLAQYDMCSTFFFLAAGLNHATAPTPEAFQQALAGLTDLPEASASSLGDGYGPGKHWGTKTYRNLRFDDGCSCFLYVGPGRPV